MVRGRGSFFLSYAGPVRRTILLGALASILAVFAPPSPSLHAEWEVRRRGNEGLIEQAARALAERPTDRALASKLVRMADKARLARLLDSFKARAQASPTSYAAVMAYAQLLRAAGSARPAIELFEKAATLHPDSADPISAMAAALKDAGDQKAAVAAYERALPLERRPPERRRVLQALIALCGDPADAEHELGARRELVKLDPGDEGAALALADLLERTGHPDEGARVLEARVPRVPGGPGVQRPPAQPRAGSGPQRWPVQLVLRAAALHEAAGAYPRASELLLQLLDTLPASAADRRREIWARAIRVARRGGGLGDLGRELEARNRTDDQKGRPRAVEWEALAQVRDELGDLEGALVAARRASALDPANVDLGRRMVALLDRLGLDDDATAELARLAERVPGEPSLTIDLLERLFRRGARDRARTAFDRALQRFGARPPTLAQLADLATRWSEDERSLATWTRLRRLAPHDEVAILALGEQLFQRKKKELAIRTWQALRDGRSSRAEGHERLAEVLLEHDLLGEATIEVQKAQALEPDQPRHHRTLAQILERQRRPEASAAEWDKVLRMNRGPTHFAERHEARSRILALAGRDGRVHLNERIRELQAQVRRDPKDREAALFLAEAEARNGNLVSAIATLRATIEQDRSTGTPAPSGAESRDDVRGDLVLALVRLLRQTRQLEEAIQHLEALSASDPARAREAQIQIADIELERYDDDRALEHAERAAHMSTENAQALLRVAEVEERAGESERALATYRRAFARDGSPGAAFALSRLLVRRGAPREACEVLRAVLRNAGDEETIAEAGRRAIDLEEYQGSLPDLERLVAGLVFSAQNGSAYRRVLVDLYRRLLPSVYRAPPPSAAAAEDYARMGQHGLRPLLELITDSEGDPERGLVELLGMLGNRDAAPALSRLAQGLTGPSSDSPGKSTQGQNRTEAQLAAIIALGRLGDARGRTALKSLLASPDASLRAAAVWAYGRVAGPDAGDLLASVSDARSDVAAFALLGLGRAHDARWGSLLAAYATDIGQPARLRRAATVALGLSGDRTAVPALLDLIDSGDEDLAAAAAAALGLLRDPAALAPLLERALMRVGPRADGDSLVLAALDRIAAGGRALDDEARAIDGNRLDVDAMLSLLCAPPPASDRTTLWIDHASVVGQILARGLGQSRETRLRVLTLLDSRDDGLALGALTPTAPAKPRPPSMAALEELVHGLAAQLLALVDDADPTVQAPALRVMAKLGDNRITPAKIIALINRAPTLLADAAGFATARWIARHPDGAAGFVALASAALNDGGPVERRLATVEVLRQAGGEARRPLEAALADQSPFVRVAAVEALADHAASVQALVDLASDPTATVRAAVARALARRSTPAAQSALLRLAQDPSAMVRAAAVQIEP